MKKMLIDSIIDIEGGFVDDPADSGGATKYGITESVARAYGYHGEMEYLTRATAFEIYEERYWQSVRGDALLALSPAICEEVVDTSINMGVVAAVKFVQRALRVLTGDDLLVDGLLGKITLQSLIDYLSHRDEKTFVKALNCLQGAKYIQLAESRKKDQRFIYGWLSKRVEI